jgi:cytoskeletal protein RodZ
VEPPFEEEFDDLDEMDEIEDETAANRRQFYLLVGGLGAVLVVAVAAFIFVMLSRNGEKSEIELTNEAVLATNQAIEEAIAATETAEVVQRTSQAIAMAATQEAGQEATAAAGTAAAETATAQPTATNTSTPTPVVAPPTATTAPTKAETPEDAAQATSTRTPIPTRGAATTPDTGVGGLGVLLVGAVLVVVIFAARRLRLAA